MPPIDQSVLVELDSGSILYRPVCDAFESAGIPACILSPLDQDARREQLARCQILVTFGLPDDLLVQAKELRFIQMMSKGFDTVNVRAAAERGIPVSGIGASNAASVAQHTWGLILALSKRIVLADRLVREGIYADADHRIHSLSPFLEDRSWRVGTSVGNRTLGIVGLGDIGSRVARIAQAFQMRTLACDPYISRFRAQLFGAELVELATLLSESDVISLHVPLTAETRKMIGAGELSQMKRGAIFVNTSRGPVIDEKALLPFLEEGRISAALDVVCEEPLPLDSPFRRLLTTGRNVILTPHLGAAADDSLVNIGEAVCENVQRFRRGKTPWWILNQEDINRKFLAGKG